MGVRGLFVTIGAGLSIDVMDGVMFQASADGDHALAAYDGIAGMIGGSAMSSLSATPTPFGELGDEELGRAAHSPCV